MLHVTPFCREVPFIHRFYYQHCPLLFPFLFYLSRPCSSFRFIYSHLRFICRGQENKIHTQLQTDCIGKRIYTITKLDTSARYRDLFVLNKRLQFKESFRRTEKKINTSSTVLYVVENVLNKINIKRTNYEIQRSIK